jgi:hypothetical protein
MAKSITEFLSSPRYRRPCSDCGKVLINPGDEQKRCKECALANRELRLQEFWKERLRRRKAKPAKRSKSSITKT